MFSIYTTKEQDEKVAAFIKRISSDNAATGATGGRFTYSFTPTTIGCVCTIEDCITGEKLDYSDYEGW